MFKPYHLLILILASILAACTPVTRLQPTPDMDERNKLSTPTELPLPTRANPQIGSTATTIAPTAIATVPQSMEISRSAWTSITNGNYIRSLLFDRSGMLWAVGSGGVVRWNPKDESYTKFMTEDGLANNDVYSVAQTKDGAMWFGTFEGGFSRFDGNIWKTFNESDGFPTATIVYQLAASSDGGLWVAGNGLFYYDGQSWTSYAPGNGWINADVISVGADGDVWVGGQYTGLYRFDGKQWTDFRQDLGLSTGEKAKNFVTALTQAADGAMWVGMLDGGLYRYDGHIWTQFHPWPKEDGIGVAALAAAADGTIWAGFSGLNAVRVPREMDAGSEFLPYFGVYSYDGQQWRSFSAADGLVSNEIRAITVAPDQSIWFGSYDLGISRFDEQDWKTYQTKDGLLSNTVETLALSPQGDLWAGFRRGASRFDGKEWVNYPIAGDLADVTGVHTLYASPDGSILGGGGQGLAWFDGDRWSVYSEKQYPMLAPIYSITSLADGTYLVGIMHGLTRFHGKALDHLQTIETDVTFVNAIIEDAAGKIWLGTSDGIYAYDEKQNTIERILVKEESIWSIAIGPDQKIWFGSDEGLVSFDGKQWKRYSYRNGDTSSTMLSIAIDRRGTIWAATGDALLRFDGKEWSRFSTQDGLAGYSVRVVVVAPDDSIWVATFSGISHFLPPLP